MKNYLLHGLGLLLAAVIFAVDINVPLGYAGGVSYVLVILSTLKLGKKTTLSWAIVCTILTAVGFFLSENTGTPSTIVIANRVTADIAIWVAAIVLMKRTIMVNLDQFIESAPDGLIIVDSDAVITSVNSELERMFGYDHNELIGQKIEVLVPAELAPRHPALRDAYIANPVRRSMQSDFSTDTILWGTRKDGTRIPVDIGLCPFKDNCGSVVAAIRDLSDRYEAKKMLFQTRDELKTLAELDTQSLADSSKHLESSRDELDMARQKICDIAARLGTVFGDQDGGS